MKKGFTLIELLVVVLIIGILSAIAFPQYNKAVLKSRFAALMPLTRAVADAEELYYLDNGNYTASFENLDIDYAKSNGSYYYFPNGYCSLAWESKAIMCGITNITPSLYYVRYFKHGTAELQGKSFCVVPDADSVNVSQQVCQNITQKTPTSRGDFKFYEMN